MAAIINSTVLAAALIARAEALLTSRQEKARDWWMVAREVRAGAALLRCLEEGKESPRVLIGGNAEALREALRGVQTKRFVCCGAEAAWSGMNACGCEEAHGPNSYAELRSASTATVEAEYGDEVVEGSSFTLAHHGPRSGNPSPCAKENVGPYSRPGVIGISHVDLDTMGGIMALWAMKPEAPGFWALAAYVDLNGPHKIEGAFSPTWTESDKDRLNAYWAFSQSVRVFAPKQGVEDVTEQVMLHALAIALILEGDEELIQAGRDFVQAQKDLDKESFVRCEGGVVVRRSPKSVNFLYQFDNNWGEVGSAVVAMNTTTGAIIISFRDSPYPHQGAIGLAQRLWGKEAGGHLGIAGSPRGMRMSEEELERAVKWTVRAVRASRIARGLYMGYGWSDQCVCEVALSGTCGPCRNQQSAVQLGEIAPWEADGGRTYQPWDGYTIQELVEEGVIRDCTCGSGLGSPGIHGGCSRGSEFCG